MDFVKFKILTDFFFFNDSRNCGSLTLKNGNHGDDATQDGSV